VTVDVNDIALVIATAVHVALGLMLLTAGVAKLRHWSEFTGVVANYRLLPEGLNAAAAAVIVPAEILLGAALIFRVGMPFAAMASAALLTIFAVAMGINIRRGRTSIDCGCFRSTLRQPLEWRLVVRNVVCAAVSLACGYVAQGSYGLLWAQAALAGLVLFVIYLALNSVWALDASRRAAFGGR
jgi:hypothetical protein